MNDIAKTNPFFVISPTVTAEGVRRTPLLTKDDAIEHAKQLIRRTMDRRGHRPYKSEGAGSPKLFVVQVVAVVEVPGPPIEVRDTVTGADFRSGITAEEVVGALSAIADMNED